MQRTVVLRHTLPDGSSHYDWMLEPPGAAQDGENARTLVTFRLMELPTPDRPIDAELLPPHRWKYLHYEGEVSGGRGAVERVMEGECRIEVEEPGRIEAVIAFEGEVEHRWEGAVIAGPIWRLLCRGPTGR